MPIYQYDIFGDRENIGPVKHKPKPKETVGKFLMLGAGLQSSLMVEMVVSGELDRPDMVIFSDTGNEPDWVYRQVEHLSASLKTIGMEITIVSNGHIINDLKESKRFASMPLWTKDPVTGQMSQLKRQCTADYKIIPSNNAVLDWLIERGFATYAKDGSRRVRRSVQVELWYGFTTDERYRLKKPSAWRKPRYPLIELNMSRADCVTWYKRHNLPIPRKSSCIVCPFHNDDYWLSLPPDEFEFACRFDDDLRKNDSYFFNRVDAEVYLHPSGVPLRDVDFTKKEQRNPFEIELIRRGGCGTDGGFSCHT